MKISDMISQQAEAVFSRAVSCLPTRLAVPLTHLSSELPSRAGRLTATRGWGRMVREVEQELQRRTPDLSENNDTLLRQALVASLALSVPKRLEREDLPESVLALIPKRLDRLADHFSSGGADTYGSTDDFYLKDLKFVLLLSLPCGSNDVDLISRVPFSSAIMSVLRSGDMAGPFRYLANGGFGVWFRLHTDTRNLGQFNERGVDECFQRVADLLIRRKRVRGLTRTSWFVDPRLEQISPHLGYLQRNPTSRGAFLLRHSSHQVDIAWALQKSKKRRRLYEAGRYKPVSYSFLWPRKALLSWAAEQRRA